MKIRDILVEDAPKVRTYTDKFGSKKYEVLDSDGVRRGPEFTDKKAAKEWLTAHRSEM
jgi:hypothetical protein